jgi:dienelactone hydrolase
MLDPGGILASSGRLKVTEARIYLIEVGGRRPVLAHILTDKGITGIGEAAEAYGTAATAAAGMIKDLAQEFLLGKDPFAIEAIWSEMYDHSFWAKGGGSIVFAGISAIEQALWDIRAKRSARRRVYHRLMRPFIPALLISCAVSAQELSIPKPAERELKRVNYHRVTSKRSPAPEPGAENTALLSPLTKPDGERIRDAREWREVRRPQLLAEWTRILGKISPAPRDMQWFGDVTKVVEQNRREMDGYTRIDLDIPIEKDFFQRHLLLLPKGQGSGPFPAVIAWTSSTPDYREPEQSWGAYLARRGYVVLTSWSFIRNYRQGTRHKEAAELVYERFGRWLAMSKMVHDVSREIEYLRSLPQVDGKRIGFIGFSLSAKTAVYVAAFNPDVKVTVAVDPHIAINGGTNWYAPWYLDWQRKFDDIETPERTVQSLLNPDPQRPGFEHDHHELLALAAPRAFLLIGGSQSEDAGGDSDDLQSWGYFNRAKEVYQLLGVPERLQFASTSQGHMPAGEQIDPAWQSFLRYFLKDHPIE